jgi:putative ABC transport system permease protein
VANVLKDGNAGAPLPEIYRVLRPTEPFFNYQIVVRTRGDVHAIVPALQNAVRDAAPDATVNATAMTDRFRASIAEPRLATAAFGVLAALAAVLTAVGIYAALSHRLSQRRRELGVRVAVGACRIDLIRMLISQGITPTLIGIAMGMIAAVGVSQAMRAVLFGIAPLDAIAFMAAPLVLVPVVFTACLLPALRASRVDPMASLRAE